MRYLNSDDIVAIVQQWLKEFYEENQATPPHSLYPFDESKLRELGRSKPTIRSVLKWCAEHFVVPDGGGKPDIDGTDTKEDELIHSVESYFQNELANVNTSIDSLLEDEAKISYALWLAFCSLVGETVEGIKIEKIEEVEASPADQGYIDFKIVGNNKKVKIGVDVIQQSGGNSVAAALKRLIGQKQLSSRDRL